MRRYFDSVFKRRLVSSIVLDALLVYIDIQSQNECTFWIRRSSGRLCVDLIPANSAHLWDADGTDVSPLPGIKPSESPTQEAMAIDSLTLEQYHEICYWNLSRQHLSSSTSATVNLSAIIACASADRLEDLIEIALLPDAEVYLGSWRTPETATGEDVEGGWTRYYDFILATW
jgi:hypothetical protein